MKEHKMQFSKNELHIINSLKFYKVLSAVSMLLGGFGIPFGIHALFFSYDKSRLNISLIAASSVVMAMAFLMRCFLSIIEKYKERMNST